MSLKTRIVPTFGCLTSNDQTALTSLTATGSMLVVMRPIVLIILGLVLCYFPVVELGFVSDDNGLITHPVTGIAQQSIESIFSGDLWHFQESQSGYYRPLMMLSLMADHTIFGDWSAGYHLHSLLWHLITVCLLFGVLRRPFGDARASIATTLFAFHPLLSEQVCFVSARNDSMALALGLAAVALTMPTKASSMRCLLASVLAAGACLSKEIGVVVLCLLPMMDWARKKNGGWHRYSALAAGAVGWLYIREMLGPGLLHSPPMNGAALMQTERITVLGTLLSKLVWPFPLTDSMHIAYLTSPAIPAVAACLFLLVFLFAFGSRWAQVGALFAIVSLVPGLMAIASRFLIGERYLALPLLGICFGLAAVLPKKTHASWAILLALPLAWSSHQRISDWTSDLTLAAAAHSAQPTAYTASWLGHEQLRAKQPEKAMALFDAATKANPPTCDFAGEWIKTARTIHGGVSGVEVGQTLWDRKCAAAPGVRGEWAHSFLEAGDFEMAQRILSPPPKQCDESVVVPFVVLAQLEGDQQAAQRCIQSSGSTISEKEEQIARLVEKFRLMQKTDPTAPLPDNAPDAPPSAGAQP